MDKDNIKVEVQFCYLFEDQFGWEVLFVLSNFFLHEKPLVSFYDNIISS